MTEQKIKIVKDGPYLVTGNVPLSEKIITEKDGHNILTDGRALPQKESYALCRCGHTKTPPFCDGSHMKEHFKGQEVCSKDTYAKRARREVTGPALDLYDDGRCAYARFCHRSGSNAWDLTEKSDDPKLKNEAIIAASECPSGRLTAADKDGHRFENKYMPSIEILMDPMNNAAGPISVKGGIPIESADGKVYEIRNRVTLCRCGRSQDKPFCDAEHIPLNPEDK
jgi:CDGSH-type Zn-finger protein